VFEQGRLLLGHGEGSAGPEAATALRQALASSRRGLPGVLLRLPFAGGPEQEV
jgi:hypothetical protein